MRVSTSTQSSVGGHQPQRRTRTMTKEGSSNAGGGGGGRRGNSAAATTNTGTVTSTGTRTTATAAGRKMDSTKRTNITILVLGDEGVGKSSLISTFVSRHFSDVVPGIMTRVRLPPDPENSCITTIVDSQGGDVALMSAVAALSMAGGGQGTTAAAGTSAAASAVGGVGTTMTTSTGAASSVIGAGGGGGGVNTSMSSSGGSASDAAGGTHGMAGGGTGTTTPMALSSSLSKDGFGGDTGNASSSSGTGSAAMIRPAGGDAGVTPLHRVSSNIQRSFATSASATGTAGIENVDSIILIYDLDRDETFFRLENHWLPLIERCYSGELPVIVAGNKMDLFLPSSTAGVTDEQMLARSRQQIVALMQRFRFIRQCIKCSAKNLLRVDEVFLKAQQAVLYPFTPLYDLDIGRLSEDCQRAFTRIFRMYDRDHDGLLSHSELDRFQHETFHVPVYERDLTGWKKVISRNNPNDEVVRDGKFTVAGFLAIFDVFVSTNRLDVPWQALRKFGYDDNLNLTVPESVLRGPDDASWMLTPSARRFLTELFYQYDSERDGILSLDDLDAIFSIIPEPSLPPWHPVRSHELFGEMFSRPKMPPGELPRSESSGSGDSPMGISQSLSASGITIVSGDSFPTVDMSAVGHTNYVSRPLAFLEWMGLWHSMSAISPETTRAELYRLGHTEDIRKSKRRRTRKNAVAPERVTSADSLLPSREMRVLILGSPGSGKTSLINSLSGSSMGALEATKTKGPETTCTFVRLKRKTAKSSKKREEFETMIVHLILTEVPEAEAEQQATRQRQLLDILSSGGCDLVVLTFDSTNSASLAYATHLEKTLLTDDISRVYVATKSDQCIPAEEREDAEVRLDMSHDDEYDWEPTTVIDEATIHCRELDLEPPLITSAGELKTTVAEGGDETAEQKRSDALRHLACCCINEPGIERLRARPHEESKRREAIRRRNRKMLWLGVGVGVAVAVVGYLWTGSGSTKAGDRRSSGNRMSGWFRTLFGAD